MWKIETFLRGCGIWSVVFLTAIAGYAATVTNTLNTGAGSLRTTIVNAAPGETINFNIPVGDPSCVNGVCTINLNSTITISKNITLNGTGANSLIIRRSAAAAANFSIFTVNTSGGTVKFTVNALTVSHGTGSGGGINNQSGGEVVVSGSVFRNHASAGGGAIFSNSSGTLLITNTTFSNNNGGSSGGAIVNDGISSATVVNSTFIGNSVSAAGGSGGGAIANDNGSSMAIAGSTFVSNSCGGNGGCGGGAISSSNGSTLEIEDSVFRENTADSPGGSTGGAVFNVDSEITVERCSFESNTAANGGGGALSSDGAATAIINDSAFMGNFAPSGGGGGFLNTNGSLGSITNTTFANNLTNGTDSAGGGILNIYTDSQLTLTNVTIAGNSVVGNGGGSGGGINNSEKGVVNIYNTIISGNAAPTAPDVSGAFDSLGFNLIENRTGSSGWTTGDLPDGTDPLLAPPGDYGGSTRTFALTGNSPAIDGGAAKDAPGEDQRGAARLDPPDIGAYEFNTTFISALPDGLNGQSYNHTIVASNGNFAFSVTDGNLPPGLNLTATFAPGAVVAVSGTPTQAGVFNFEITGTDGTDSTVNNYSLTIRANTSASVTVGGRILTLSGQPISRAIVILTDAGGTSRTVVSNSFGFYRFDNVTTGAAYAAAVIGKGYNFSSQVITVSGEITALDFIVAPQLNSEESAGGVPPKTANKTEH